MEYLDFELPIKELQEQITKCQAIGDESSVDVTETCKLLVVAWTEPVGTKIPN